MRKKKLNVVGHSTTAQDKKEIQRLLREIVMLRDKKCILYGKRCHHQIGVEGIVWQAEHLIERSNSETYADSRLVVLVCKNCHGWKHFKKSNHDQYDEWVRESLSPERVKLWDECRKNLWKPCPQDWKLHITLLNKELSTLQDE